MRRLTTCALVALALAACRQPGLTTTQAAFSLSPEVLDFGAVYAGKESRTLDLTVRNDGKVTVELEWSALDLPFEVSALPVTLAPGFVRIPVRFNPPEVGAFKGVLRVESEGIVRVVALQAEARAVPKCADPKPCFSSAFDFTLQRCVEEPLANGTTCNPQTVCLVNAICQAGRCVGTARDCNDQNLCTIDTCNAVVGCEHLPAPPCPGDGACQLGVCNPATGCGRVDADDGFPCGTMQGCDVAQVCIGGVCVERDPPDGYVCAEASPCRGEGLCAGSTCVTPVATKLKPSWEFDAFFADAGAGKPPEYHDLMLEPSGAVTLSGFFDQPPLLRANTPAAKTAQDAARRCMLWNGKLLCADYPSSAAQGNVTAIDLATGATLWTFSLPVARPDFLAKTSSLFMSRMAAQGSDRLAALFEAYPKGSSGNTHCRRYFLAVLDGAGKLVSAQQVTDPLLDDCNHPHPYGFGADAAGHLFISFSPTTSVVAPLVPGTPTLLMSFTRDGVFRWKTTDPSLTGGELAVARGLLYPENGSSAILTATGEVAFSLTELYGRAVISQSRTIVAPTVGATRLNGYESGTSTARWVHKLPLNHTFDSDQLRLASWQTRKGKQTIALTFTHHFGRTLLHGIVAHTGAEAFTCELDMASRSGPQLFEVADGSLTLMEGSPSCGKCDPPYAGSAAAFHTIPLPLISPPLNEPWVGTFGGPGHDHHEEPPVPSGPPQ